MLQDMRLYADRLYLSWSIFWDYQISLTELSQLLEVSSAVLSVLKPDRTFFREKDTLILWWKSSRSFFSLVSQKCFVILNFGSLPTTVLNFSTILLLGYLDGETNVSISGQETVCSETVSELIDLLGLPDGVENLVAKARGWICSI